jgi:bifunctional non-homologous end joining protein LigD
MAGDRLKRYRQKRDFSRTSEPAGGRAQPARAKVLRYVIQKHAARALHYDFRLEHDGVLLSWAVPKGPSENPADKRLAVQVEDHPLDYGNFEGTIPQGEYGGGTVMLWDRGRWLADGDVDQALRSGKLLFALDGERLHGLWALVRLRPREGDRRKNWLLIKEKDDYVQTGKLVTARETTSVKTGRSMEEIATGNSRVWHSSHGKTRKAAAKKRATKKAAVKKKTVAKTGKKKAARRTRKKRR